MTSSPSNDDLVDKEGFGFVDATRTFVRALFREREMPGCHFFTSHETLCISRFAAHRETCDNPLLSITGATSPNRLHFTLRIETSAPDDVRREVAESANWPGRARVRRIRPFVRDVHRRRNDAQRVGILMT
jgi:hypothetical protein